MRILVLGGYGLIGLEVCRALLDAGHLVVGLGRTIRHGQRALPAADWIAADIGARTDPDDWAGDLSNIDAVVNCAGALQSGGKDNVDAVQRQGIIALIDACEQAGVRRFVQVSAPGAEPGARTEFLATKAAADQALRDSRLDWTILKPGLVIGRNAYGGTSLVRMLAAFPWVQPIALPNAQVQTVALSDVAAAVVRSVEGGLARREFDLVENRSHALRDIVANFRHWLGFAPASSTLALPGWMATLSGRAGDLAGRLGWRPALRTTALEVLSGGVAGDPGPWREATGDGLMSLRETLGMMPATRQDRLAARVELVMPVLLVAASIFWILSGLIGLARIGAAAQVLADDMNPVMAGINVLIGVGLDLCVGVGLLWRRFARKAALMSIGVSGLYLVAGTHFTPEMWADPLGPFVKIIPVIALGLTLAIMLEER